MREWHSQITASPIQSLHLGWSCVYQCVCAPRKMCGLSEALLMPCSRKGADEHRTKCCWRTQSCFTMARWWFQNTLNMVYCTCICMAKQCSRHSTFWWTFESSPAEHVEAFETSNIHTLLQQAWCQIWCTDFQMRFFTQHHKGFLKCVALVQLFLLEQFFVDLAVLDYIGCWYVSFLSKPTLNLFIAAKQNCQSPWIWRFDHSNRCPLPAIDLVIESQTLWPFVAVRWLEWRVSQKTYHSYPENLLIFIKVATRAFTTAPVAEPPEDKLFKGKQWLPARMCLQYLLDCFFACLCSLVHPSPFIWMRWKLNIQSFDISFSAIANSAMCHAWGSISRKHCFRTLWVSNSSGLRRVHRDLSFVDSWCMGWIDFLHKKLWTVQESRYV